MAGRCQRIVDTSCPAGSVRKGAICAAITLPPPRPPPVAAVPPPVRTPGQAATAAADSDFVPDEVLIEITDATPKPIVDRLIATYALQLLSERRLTYLDVGLYRLRIPRSETVPSVVAALSREAGVAAAQPNYIYRLNAGSVATAPVKLPQYAVDLIKARQAHGVSRGQNVLVAVIDTGIDRGHPEIGDAVTKSFDAFTADSGQASPASNAKVATATGAAIAGATGDGSTGPFADAHGTGIAGIIAASGQLQGVAPDARILAVRAFEGTSSATEPRVSAGGARSGRGGNVGARGTGTTERVAAGLDWALENGARVVNMSFEGSRDDLVTRLIDKGDGDGVVFVAAAGNGGPKARPAFPAALPAVIAVTAIDDRQAIYAHANAGAYIDLAAPGVNVLVPAPDNAYDMASGTSFAAAHVSGIAALVLSRSPRIGRAGLRDQLRSTAVDLGKPGSDETFGAGAVDAMKALDDQTAQAAAPSRR